MPVEETPPPPPILRQPQPVEPVAQPVRVESAPIISPPTPVEPATSRSLIPETPVAASAAAAAANTAPRGSEAVRPAPMPIIPQTGKEATIYVSLVGEGLNVLRSVKAEHVGRDFYRIVEPMPEGESWQFQPGQVVRCKKKNLSSGKGLVATEEAPRAR